MKEKSINWDGESMSDKQVRKCLIKAIHGPAVRFANTPTSGILNYFYFTKREQ